MISGSNVMEMDGICRSAMTKSTIAKKQTPNGYDFAILTLIIFLEIPFHLKKEDLLKYSSGCIETPLLP